MSTAFNPQTDGPNRDAPIEHWRNAQNIHLRDPESDWDQHLPLVEFAAVSSTTIPYWNSLFDGAWPEDTAAPNAVQRAYFVRGASRHAHQVMNCSRHAGVLSRKQQERRISCRIVGTDVKQSCAEVALQACQHTSPIYQM
jgi:hypothetical protein